jgi:hypothetical protein
MAELNAQDEQEGNSNERVDSSNLYLITFSNFRNGEFE